MPSLQPSPLARFHEFIGHELEVCGDNPVTPERALELWQQRQADLAAIREGLEQCERGDVRPVEEFLNELRADNRGV